MKKIVQVLITIEIAVLFLLGVIISVFYMESKVLYGNTNTITILSTSTDNKLSSQTLNQKIIMFNQIAYKNHIQLTKIARNSEQFFSIYTNTPQKFTKKTTLVPKIKKQYFLSNKKEKQNSQQLGVFQWIDQRQQVRLYSLEGLEHVGIDGLYFVEKGDPNQYNLFKSKLKNELGLTVKEEENYQGEKQLLKAIFQEPLLISTILLLFLTTSFALLFIFIKRSKKISLMNIIGYSRIQQFILINKLFFPYIILGFFIGFIILLTYQLLILKSQLTIPVAMGFSLIGVVLLLLLISIISILWLYMIEKSKNFYLYIKGKKPTRPLLIVSKIFILLFLLILPFFSIQANNNYQQFKLEQEADKTWLRAQNVYQTSLQYIGHEPQITRPYEKKIKNFYMKNLDKLALIDVSNYDLLSSGQPVYRANTSSALDELISPNGRSIRINETYLKWNPVYKIDGTLVTSKDICKQQSSINLLVPIKLKKYEQKIKQKYIEDFHERTDKLATEIYQEHVSVYKPLVNIIFVKNNQKYFTYDEMIASKQQNLIEDPIINIDIGNLDPSIYYSDVAQHIFFKTVKGKSGYEQLSYNIHSAGVQDQIQLIHSVYNQRAKTIQEHHFLLYYYICLLVISVGTLVLCISLFNYSLFEQNKKKILLEFFHGYSKWQIIFQHFLPWLLLDIVVLNITSYLFYAKNAWFLLILVLFIELGTLAWLPKTLRGVEL